MSYECPCGHHNDPVFRALDERIANTVELEDDGEEAVFEPRTHKAQGVKWLITYRGVTRSVGQWADHYRMHRVTLLDRLHRGVPFAAAVNTHGVILPDGKILPPRRRSMIRRAL